MHLSEGPASGASHLFQIQKLCEQLAKGKICNITPCLLVKDVHVRMEMQNVLQENDAQWLIDEYLCFSS